MMRVRAAVLLTAVGGLVTALASQIASPHHPWREYPSLDASAMQVARRGSLAKEATARLARTPGDPETLRLLLDQERRSEALASLRAAVARDVPTVVEALRILHRRFHVFEMNQAEDHVSVIRQMLGPVRARVEVLPREDAARLALALSGMDGYLDRQTPTSQRLSRFIERYDGTQAAELAKVFRIAAGPETTADYVRELRQRLDELDKYWKAHPDTEAGIQALHSRGFRLGAGAAGTGIEPAGADPTDRLAEVADIVGQLERLGSPSRLWDEPAASLLTGFFVRSRPPPAYGPGNVERSIAIYQDFVRSHFDPHGPVDPIDTGLGYVITEKLGGLYELQGSRAAGIERTLADLEASGADAYGVALLGAQVLMREMARPGSDRSSMLEKARTVLEALARTDSGYFARKALATLAALNFNEGEFGRASRDYERYIARFPSSAWAWLASYRRAESLEARGDLPGAAAVFQRVATAFTAEPLAGVMGRLGLARLADASGQFERSLDYYRGARDAWDDDYGLDYTAISRPAAGQAGRPRLTKDVISKRIEALERDLGTPGGLSLARARRQMDEGNYASASAALTEFLASERAPDGAREARTLLHRAQLLEALDLASVNQPTPNPAAASKLLDALAREPLDSAVAAARLAKAVMLLKRGDQQGARTLTGSTLDAWIEMQRERSAKPAASPLDADIGAIRSLVFTPTGTLALLRNQHWSSFTFPTELPRVIMVNATVAVKTADGQWHERLVYQSFPGVERVVTLEADDLALLTRIVVTLGGSATREPTSVMQRPNQPIGTSMDIIALWNEFFPARPGHWGGWVLLTYPVISRIEFANADRTRAYVAVGLGDSGATLVVEKLDGSWKAVRLVNWWIT